MTCSHSTCKALCPENTPRKRNIDQLVAKSVMDDMHEICTVWSISCFVVIK